MSSYIILLNIKSGKFVKKEGADVVRSIYYRETRMPNKKEVEQSTDVLAKELLKLDDYEMHIRNYISSVVDLIPLFDIYNKNIFLINKKYVYNRVVYHNLRPLDKEIIEIIKELNYKYKELYNKRKDNLIAKRLKKTSLMVDFLNYYNIETYYKTYTYVFYNYSNHFGKNITTCIKPSFTPRLAHIEPYYTRSQIINSALNMGINVPKEYIDNKKLLTLCEKVSTNDINHKILSAHQKHIVKNDGMGLLQYYTIQGSYFMNQYLRGVSGYTYENSTFNSLTKDMTSIISSAPEFDKPYILYRFVFTDEFLSNLKIGDIFTEEGFLSTTRDPFYQSDTYQFGAILIKIRIPANKKGVALCLEAVSHFPKEYEIIFSPGSKFKLIAKDENITYHHTDVNITSNISKRYEFIWLETPSKVDLKKREPEQQLKLVNFLQKDYTTITLEESISFFIEKNADPSLRLLVKIGNTEFIAVAEWYNSTGVYKDFYAVKTDNGFSIYSIYQGYLLFMIEIATVDGKVQMHVNYYVKYNTLIRENLYTDDEFLNFIASVAYQFNVDTVIIYAEYKRCTAVDNYSKVHSRSFSQKEGLKGPRSDIKGLIVEESDIGMSQGSYCVDIINYLNYKTKRFNNIDEILSGYSYQKLDYLDKIDPMKILYKEDQDEIYQIYKNLYIEEGNKSNLKEFILWLYNKKCYLLEVMTKKVNRILKDDNPFESAYYLFDYQAFLYNRGMIVTYTPNTLEKVSFNRVTTIRKNRYRLDR